MSGPDPRPLVLASGLGPEQVGHILRAYGIQHVAEADANLQAMAGEPHHRRPLAEILPLLLDSVSRTADPDQALNHWERLLASVSRAPLLDYLRTSPRMVDLLSTLFGNSDSLAFTLIRDPMLIYWLGEPSVLDEQPRAETLSRSLTASLKNVSAKDHRLDALRRFKRRETLRIGLRDLLRLADVPETTASLSDLAALLIQTAYEIVSGELRRHYGVPMHKNAQGRWVETGFAVIGMGKLGGHELNYSSDVDLIYVYTSDNGETRPTRGRGKAKPAGVGISSEEYFELLSRELTKALSESTREGAVFRVDLRLRAEGSVGQLARSLDDYRKYYATRGQVWERLALLKAWPVAGSTEVGQAFLKAVKPFVFGGSAISLTMNRALAVIRDVRAVKEMIDGRMAERGHERRNVKLGTGGIREIEFLVQTIQVLAGKAVPALLDRSTLGALRRFAARKLLSIQERDGLTAAYIFLRDVEHKLQMVHDLQTHALPESGEELVRCAIRAGYESGNRTRASVRFHDDYERHTALVNRMFRSLYYEPTVSPLLKATLAAARR
ncbi:hypothetical protein YTPLAS18_39250 [Nitrospira sp.]|nr:hypothetical protein YTPLAS18_39250 [Nitrospira sp.]